MRHRMPGRRQARGHLRSPGRRVTAPRPQIVFSELSEAEVLEIALEAQRAARKDRSKRK